MGRPAECIQVTVLLAFLMYHCKGETSQLLISPREQTGLVHHGSKMLQGGGICVYFEKAIIQDMFPFHDTLYHCQQFSFVTRIISLILVTLPSPATQESLFSVLNLGQYSGDILLAPVCGQDEWIFYSEVWKSLGPSLGEHFLQFDQIWFYLFILYKFLRFLDTI